MNDASGRPAVSPERTALRSTIVAVVLLDASPDWDRVGEILAGGTLEAPAFRHRVVDVPFGLAPPRWAGENDSDLPWQLDRVTLTAPATFDDVLEYARTTAAAAAPEQPRWELTLVEGLLGGQSALLIRIHHAYADGADGTHITARIVDLERNRPDQPEAEPSPGPPAAETADGVGDRALNSIGFLVESVSGLVQNLTAPFRRLVSSGEPERSDDRRLLVVDVPIVELREAAARARSTLDSAFLAAILLGLADYRFRRGTDVDELSLAMPLADTENGGTGISLSRADLPVPADDPGLLMRLLDEYAGPATEPGRHLAPPPNLLPAVVDDPLDHDDVFACTVPGSHVPLYVAGAKIEKYYGFGPTLGSAFNVTLMSYLDNCCLGFTVDTDAVRDPAMFDDCIRAGLRAVLES
ncbi:wax ester/triacylglycerol synthase domain-containing protein [Rhodococcus phenolicus]|uniref:wax ester/triacylglycerol synthase domain-containing protein n=1 Tax=Rhodococcus phenolicus TaxID=263849 RepID=UPI0008369554|nr:wax ester/triacylglycerol synthase domain-containing protein [Rhodococcus phenolicus]